MLNIAKRQILPATVKYSSCLADAINAMVSAGADAVTHRYMLEKVSGFD